MNWILQKIKFLVYVPVVVTILVGVLALAVGVWKSYLLVELLVSSGPTALTPLLFLRIMDSFIIGNVLFLFAIGLHVLFIGDLKLPEAYQARSLHDLESKIGNLIILVLALFLLERILEAPTDPSLLPLAGAFALVTAGIIAFTFFKAKESTITTENPSWK